MQIKDKDIRKAIEVLENQNEKQLVFEDNVWSWVETPFGTLQLPYKKDNKTNY